jgi:uncharacterized protein (DUF2267 family)
VALCADDRKWSQGRSYISGVLLPEDVALSVTGVDSLDRSIHKTNAWLADVASSFDTDDRRFAYRVVRAWLHTLRDRLGVDASAHLAAQLPELLRGGLLRRLGSEQGSGQVWLRRVHLEVRTRRRGA